MGRDAGLLRLRIAGDGMPRKSGDTLTVEVLGAAGLFSDTPPIRDLASFPDWDDCCSYGLFLGCYVLAGTIWFAFYFDRFACGEMDCAAFAPVAIFGSTPPAPLNGSDVGIGNQTIAGLDEKPTVATYPNDAGPWLDALLFGVATTFSVGWYAPICRVSRPLPPQTLALSSPPLLAR